MSIRCIRICIGLFLPKLSDFCVQQFFLAIAHAQRHAYTDARNFILLVWTRKRVQKLEFSQWPGRCISAFVPLHIDGLHFRNEQRYLFYSIILINNSKFHQSNNSNYHRELIVFSTKNLIIFFIFLPKKENLEY